MVELLLGFGCAALLFIVFFIFLFRGLRKRNWKLMFVAFIFFLGSLALGLWMGFTLSRKAYEKISNTKIEHPFRARTGKGIYAAVFGEPADSCVEVVNNVDQYIPKIDCCIWLEIRSCPEEFARILSRDSYQRSILGISDSAKYLPSYGPRPEWFTPGNLGDSLILFRKFDPSDPNHDKVLLVSTDSTRAFYCDMAE